MRMAPVAVVSSMTVVSVPAMTTFGRVSGTFSTGVHLYLTRDLSRRQD